MNLNKNYYSILEVDNNSDEKVIKKAYYKLSFIHHPDKNGDPIIFGELDKFEGEEYIRTKARTSSDIECWIYLYKYDTTGIKEIKSGDWMLR